MSEIYVLALSVVFSLIVVKLCHWVYQWSNPKCKGKLPPGSMGFPIIGETFEFMTPFDISLVVSPYLKKRISRFLNFLVFIFEFPYAVIIHALIMVRSTNKLFHI